MHFAMQIRTKMYQLFSSYYLTNKSRLSNSIVHTMNAHLKKNSKHCKINQD